MIKTGTILLLRKLREKWIQGSIYLLALSVSYILLTNGIFYKDWSQILFSVAITGALHLSEQPLISKNEIKLQKLFGANNFNIWPTIFIQSLTKAIIVALVALAVSGASRLKEILPLEALFEMKSIWILPLVICLFWIFISFLHFRLFIKSSVIFSE